MTCALAPRRHRSEGHLTTDGPLEATAAPAVLAASRVLAPAPRRWHPSAHGVLGRAAGWALVVVGVALLPLPGPGTLVLVAGLRMLVPHHSWAAASYDRLRERAIAAGRAGVRTPARVAASIAGVAWVAVLAGVYALDPAIPRIDLLGLGVGPSLPFHGTATTVGLVVSTLASALATGYGVARLRPQPSAAVSAPTTD